MLLHLLGLLQAAVPQRPALRAGPLTDPIHLDGRLTEAAWAAADSITALTQVEPREGAPATGRTVVRVLVSPDLLLIGIVADDPDPSGLVAYSRQRDADLRREDHVRLVLDTFQDGRSGYVFAISPLGARYDALITGQGENENSDWDAVWQAKAVRTPTGWSAEIRIPLKSLIFQPGLDAWGFNVQRRVQRLLESSRWSGARRDFELGQTSQAGLLTGLPAFRTGAGLTIRPALTAGGRHPGPDTKIDGTVHPSLDLTQRLAGNLLGSVTVNTDFAETEVDTRQTNLTRFPIFFPEKRDFFLEGSDIFEFGLGAATDVMPFFSRRIGLIGGREVPIRGGVKLTGRAGNTNIGALVTRSGADDAAGVGPETMGAVRLRQNVLDESSVGAAFTFGDPLNRHGAWTAGADATFQTSRFAGDKNFLFGAWALATDRDGLQGRRQAAGFKLDYPNDDWDVALIYRWIGEGFQPSLGFVPRPGTQQISGGATRRFRPERGGLSEVSFRLSPRAVTDLGGRWESWRLSVQPVNLVLRSGDEVSVDITPQGERLDEPFDVADGIEPIPAGAYEFTRTSIQLESASRRTVRGSVEWTFGGFYTGTLHRIEASAGWRPTATIQLSLEAERNIGDLPQGRFTTDLVAGRIRVGLSPDLDLVSFIQYDTESRTVGTNTRVRWTFHPLGDLFVVYNHNLAHPVGERWRLDGNELLFKVKYAWRY